MRNLLIALAGFAARSILAEDTCGAQPEIPSGKCYTEEAFFFEVKECEDVWDNWDKWCYCLQDIEGYLGEEHVCTLVEDKFLFPDDQDLNMRKAVENVKKLGGKDDCKSKGECKKMTPANDKKILRKSMQEG